jgi:hypothetical protein
MLRGKRAMHNFMSLPARVKLVLFSLSLIAMGLGTLLLAH